LKSHAVVGVETIQKKALLLGKGPTIEAEPSNPPAKKRKIMQPEATSADATTTHLIDWIQPHLSHFLALSFRQKWIKLVALWQDQESTAEKAQARISCEGHTHVVSTNCAFYFRSSPVSTGLLQLPSGSTVLDRVKVFLLMMLRYS
jgi:hypothetical protein